LEGALSSSVVGSVEAGQQDLEIGVAGTLRPSTSLAMRPLKRSTMPLVWGAFLTCMTDLDFGASAFKMSAVKQDPKSVGNMGDTESGTPSRRH
jgi:hypothetical protein